MATVNLFGWNVNRTHLLIAILLVVMLVNYLSYPSCTTKPIGPPAAVPADEIPSQPPANRGVNGEDDEEENLEHMGPSPAPNQCILYYANWCGHCQNFKPTWEKIEQAFAKHSKVDVYKVDCDADKGQCQEQGIRGFPTVRFHGPNGSVDHNGPSTFEAVSQFINDNV